jgi:hypothetical protein
VVVCVSFRVVVDPDHGSVVCVVRWVVISGPADGVTTVVGSMVQELRAATAAAAVRVRIDDGFMALVAWDNGCRGFPAAPLAMTPAFRVQAPASIARDPS